RFDHDLDPLSELELHRSVESDLCKEDANVRRPPRVLRTEAAPDDGVRNLFDAAAQGLTRPFSRYCDPIAERQTVRVKLVDLGFDSHAAEIGDLDDRRTR